MKIGWTVSTMRMYNESQGHYKSLKFVAVYLHTKY